MDKSAPSLDTLFTKLLFTIVFDPILAFPLQLSLITNYLFNVSNETYCYMHGSTPLPPPPQKKKFLFIHNLFKPQATVEQSVHYWSDSFQFIYNDLFFFRLHQSVVGDVDIILPQWRFF